ncbi:MAG: helix-turn-helix domain-containing protein [Prevotellaceae bacterium]|jgi:HTH-type transcriptional regulator/antitoxin HigA|nr:helix-turn-helix domain-containing protein [Prevotellaceae bacterium]
MTPRIKNEEQYQALLRKVNELMDVVNEDTPKNDSNFVALDLLADLVEEYEIHHYPIAKPTLVDALKLSMYEMGLTQKALSEMLGVSTSRVSEYLTGKSEPTLKVARAICQQLHIDANIILGA